LTGDDVLVSFVLRDEGESATGSGLHRWSLSLVVHGGFYRVGRTVDARDAQDAGQQFAKQLVRLK